MQSSFKLDSALSRGLLDVLIKAGLVAALVIFAFQVFQPFLELMWAVILAVTLYPLHCRYPAPHWAQARLCGDAGGAAGTGGAVGADLPGGDVDWRIGGQPGDLAQERRLERAGPT
jgi:hypothetical protein